MGRQIWQSQNFLKNPEFVSDLVDMTDIGSKDTVVEIGPGKGVITRELSKRAKKVVAIEIDSRLAKNLRESFSANKGVQIIEADFLKWNLPNEPYKVFSNIPFNMTADIVNKLLTSRNSPEVVYLIMQDRAAERFIGSKKEPNTQVSMLLKPFWNMKVVTKIDRKQFQPVPNINAVLAEFKKKKNPPINPRLKQDYRDFVIFGFNQWKPTVAKAFEDVFSSKQINIISKKIDIDNLKPSELTVNQWLDLFDAYQNRVPDNRRGPVRGSEKGLQFKHKGMIKQHRTR